MSEEFKFGDEREFLSAIKEVKERFTQGPDGNYYWRFSEGICIDKKFFEDEFNPPAGWPATLIMQQLNKALERAASSVREMHELLRRVSP